MYWNELAAGRRNKNTKSQVPIPAIAHLIGYPLIGINSEGLLVAWNQATLELLGYKPQDLRTKHVYDLVSGPDRAVITHVLSKAGCSTDFESQLAGSRVEILHHNGDTARYRLQCLSNNEESGAEICFWLAFKPFSDEVVLSRQPERNFSTSDADELRGGKPEHTRNIIDGCRIFAQSAIQPHAK